MKSLLLVAISIVLVGVYASDATAEEWEVIIPSGAANPSFPTHYKPQEITVNLGDYVHWVNGDAAEHTVTSGTLETGLNGRFDSGHLQPGEVFSMLFQSKDSGENKYFCTIHPWLVGIVNVKEIEQGFQVFHNVGKGVSEKTFDLEYKVQRNIVDVKIEPVQKTLKITLAGIIDNDSLVIKLPEELIKNPNSVWIDQKQISNFKIEKKKSINQLTIPLTAFTEQVTIMGTDIIGEIKPKEFILINQIMGISDKKFYEKGDPITISGQIKNQRQLFQVLIDVISPTGVTVHSEFVPIMDDSKFTTTIQPTGIFREFGEYDVKMTGANSKTLYLSFEYGYKKADLLPPKKQVKMNISMTDVVCNEGLQLMKKVSNDSPVCVKESTGKILLQRGWATYFP